MSKGERKNRIEQAIKKYFNPSYLEVIDDSNNHRGHQHAPESGESHYNVVIKSKEFLGKNRIEKERMVYKVLEKEFTTGLHALSLKLTDS